MGSFDPNTVKNKVIYNGNTLIDLSIDDVAAADVASGKYFHLPSGVRTQGTNTKDADTSDATASASEILDTKTAYVRGNKITGSMTNNGAVTGEISTKDGTYTIPQGYHDGSGSVSISSTEQAKIIASNIRENVTILGITGSLTPETPISVEPNKNVTPSWQQQMVTPSSGYDYLAQVTVAPIPYDETINAAGGYTVTIG